MLENFDPYHHLKLIHKQVSSHSPLKLVSLSPICRMWPCRLQWHLKKSMHEYFVLFIVRLNVQTIASNLEKCVGISLTVPNDSNVGQTRRPFIPMFNILMTTSLKKSKINSMRSIDKACLLQYNAITLLQCVFFSTFNEQNYIWKSGHIRTWSPKVIEFRLHIVRGSNNNALKFCEVFYCWCYYFLPFT